MTIARRQQQTIIRTGRGLRHILTAMAILGAGFSASCSSAVDTDAVADIGKSHPTRMTVARNVTAPRVFGYSTPVKLLQTEPDRPRPDQAIKPRRSASLGSSPYICSPSGFGRKSTCFLR